MGKAILIMDEMPKSCDVCDLICMVNGKMHCGVKGCGECAKDYIICRPSWCPLKEFPEPIDVDGCKTEITKARAQEYNALLSKLTN